MLTASLVNRYLPDATDGLPMEVNASLSRLNRRYYLCQAGEPDVRLQAP